MSKEQKTIDETTARELEQVNPVEIPPKQKKQYEAIAEIMTDILREENNINIPNNMVAATTGVQFIRSVLQYLDENRSTNEKVVVNIGDYIEVAMVYRETEDEEKDGNFTLEITPGLKGKRMSKSDDVTEDE